MMERIDQALALQYTAGREAARERFAALWHELGAARDPLYRCRLAHHMADLQDDPHEELAWDVRALEAADQITDNDLEGQQVSLNIAEFYPSLHLNLAEDYRKLGDLAKAWAHADRAAASMSALGTNEYGGLIRTGITRLIERLQSSSSIFRQT
jgi:hypothetical protein